MAILNKCRKLSRNFGFTLAEVLITLGIIGVVAEMTIPSLVQNTQQQEMIVAWKKEFSVFSQAYISLQSDSLDLGSSSSEMASNFAKYFRAVKICTGASNDDCWHSYGVVKTLPKVDGSQYNLPDYSAWSGIVAADGMKAIFNPDSTVMGWVMLDVNGDKGPNLLGKDVFGLRFVNTTTSPFGYDEFGTCKPPDKSNHAGYESYIGYGCSYYYLLGGKP